ILLPGISASTVMIVIGLYGLLITNLNDMFKSRKQFFDAVIFFTPLGLGALVGILALSGLFSFLIGHFSLAMFSLFAGLTAGVIPMIIAGAYKEKEDSKEIGKLIEEIDIKKSVEEIKTKFKIIDILPFIIAAGVVLVFAIASPPETAIRALDVELGVMLVLGGMLAAADFIIPGLSGSFMLVLLGLFNTVLEAINNLDLAVLGLLIAGMPIGLFMASHIIGWFLVKQKRLTYLAIAGFLFGSVISIFLYSGTYAAGWGPYSISFGATLFIIGFLTIHVLVKLKKKPTYEL
ncbi:MAG: DUF368 domain-containing protein, partial [Firmicutes bacterium]|nr:DUF368 domain-containing protein [Bacillota bacterium]